MGGGGGVWGMEEEKVLLKFTLNPSQEIKADVGAPLIGDTGKHFFTTGNYDQQHFFPLHFQSAAPLLCHPHPHIYSPSHCYSISSPNLYQNELRCNIMTTVPQAKEPDNRIMELEELKLTSCSSQFRCCRPTGGACIMLELS